MEKPLLFVISAMLGFCSAQNLSAEGKHAHSHKHKDKAEDNNNQASLDHEQRVKPGAW